MREAIGGTMLMYIVLFFLFVYIAFMAIVINYGRVFRVKNAIVSYVEQTEGIQDANVQNEIVQLAGDMGYKGRICVCYTEGQKGIYYLSIRVFATFQLPLLPKENYLDLNISGETSAIRKVKNKKVVEGVNRCDTNGKDKFKYATCLGQGDACKNPCSRG